MSKSSFCNKFIAFSRLEHTTASCHWAFEFLTNSRLYFLVQLTWWVDFWFPKAMYPLSLFSQASFWLVRKVPPKAVLGHRQKTPCRGKERGQMEERENFSGEKGDKFGMHWVKVEWGALEWSAYKKELFWQSTLFYCVSGRGQLL